MGRSLRRGCYYTCRFNIIGAAELSYILLPFSNKRRGLVSENEGWTYGLFFFSPFGWIGLHFVSEAGVVVVMRMMEVCTILSDKLRALK